MPERLESAHEHSRLYAKALRYAADEDTVALGLKSLTPEDRHPADHLTENRARLSDAMREAGRDGEADLLADPATHVVVHEGKVVPGRFDFRHISNHLSALEDHVGDEGRLDIDTAGTHYRPEDFSDDGDPYGPPPRNHVNVIHFDTSGSDYHHNSVTHATDVPAVLAESMNDRWGDFDGWDNEPDEGYMAEFDRLLEAVRQAPVEFPKRTRHAD